MMQRSTPQPARHAGRRAATLAALAAELGVSRTTVSNAYNRPSQLSPELRERVLTTARQLGYPGPDPVARSLRMRQAGAIGLLFTEALSYAFGDPAAVLTLQGLAAACAGARTGLLLVPAASGVADGDQPALAARAAVDGFVAYSLPRGDPQLQTAMSRPGPVVIVDAPLEVMEADWVGIDDLKAATGLGEHLAALGHRDVGVIATKLTDQPHQGLVPVQAQRDSVFDVVRQRITGLATGLGTDQAQLPVMECPQQSVAAAQLACMRLLAAAPGLTAVACTTDVLALGALRAAGERGIDVPNQLSITGFDAIGESDDHNLTTVRQPHFQKGQVAWELLSNRSQRHDPIRRTLPTELLVRGTTAPHY